MSLTQTPRIEGVMSAYSNIHASVQLDSVIASTHMYINKSTPQDACALLIRGGKIVARVPYAQAALYKDEARRYIDVGDAFVCPGFHDAHQHVFHTAVFPSRIATSYCGKNELDCARHLREFAATIPNQHWVLGQGYRNWLWDPSDVPTKATLDEAIPHRPVAMYAGDCHNLWLNSCALSELGITRDTQPCAGGIIERDEDGNPTGVLREAAAMMYAARIFSSISATTLKDIYKSYFEHMLAQGVTSVCDMALSPLEGADCVREDIFESLEQDGALTLRVHLYPQLVQNLDRILNLRGRLLGPRLRACGMKQFFDGVSSAHTAWLQKPYANPYFPGDCGRPTIQPERMKELVNNALSQHIAVRIHAIGDKSVHVALGIIRDAQCAYGLPLHGRNSLEHLENLYYDDAVQLARLGVVASVQPQHATIDAAQPLRDLGQERSNFMWPFHTYNKLGVHMAFGTDAPCSTSDSRQVLSCAVTRSDAFTREPQCGFIPSEKISIIDAIDAYTRGSAYVTGRESELGTLDVGKYADLFVSNQNLLTLDPYAFQDVRVRATFLAGRCVWEA